jgi:hypothetical protein
VLSFSIDSLKLRIPAHKVQIFEPLLRGKWIKALISADTGEVIDDPDIFKQNAFLVEETGIKTRYQCQKVSNGRTTEPFLCILLNSKILKERYFEGIRPDNLVQVYDALMAHKVVRFSIEDFLGGLCSDIDFKADYELKDINQMDDLTKALENSTKKTGEREKGCRRFTGDKNKGIEWSKRQFSSPSNPFVKIYHKYSELVYKSNVFACAFLKNQNENLVRVEWTLKNKSHAQSFKGHKVEGINKQMISFDDMSLGNIIRLNDTHKRLLTVQIFAKHLEGVQIMKDDNKKQLNPIDTFISNALNLCKECGKSLYDSVQYLTQGMERKSRYQYKQKIEKLWSLDMDKEQFAKDYQVYDLLNELTGVTINEELQGLRGAKTGVSDPDLSL